MSDILKEMVEDLTIDTYEFETYKEDLIDNTTFDLQYFDEDILRECNPKEKERLIEIRRQAELWLNKIKELDLDN